MTERISSMSSIFENFLNEISRPKNARPGDYQEDGVLYCGKCNMPRQAWVDWIPDENGNVEKRLVPIMCACDVDAEKKEKERDAQQRFDESMRHVSVALHTMRDEVKGVFANDETPSTDIAKTARKYVDRWADMKDKNIGIIFYGSKGTGKTFYASCIYNELVSRRVLCGFTSVPNLMNALSAWDKTEIFDAIERVKLLVLDDFGAERDTSYGLELMYSVIDARYKTQLPTIITTNLDYADMDREQDIMRARLYDRIREMCAINLKMAGESKRREIADERRRLARELLR